MIDLSPGMVYQAPWLNLTIEILAQVGDFESPQVVYRQINGNLPPKHRKHSVQTMSPAEMLAGQLKNYIAM